MSRLLAPVLRDTERLLIWLLGGLCATSGPLQARIAAQALDLQGSVVLALRTADPERIAAADDELAILRAHLRVAHGLGLLDDAQLLHAASLCEPIGKQLGGWLRAQDAL